VRVAALLRYAVVGWVAGTLALIVLSLVWPAVLPGFVHYNHYDPTGAAPNLVLIVGVILAVASLPAIVGGVIGGRIPKEGGSRQQLMMAAIFGIILTLPLGCFSLWLFSGA
jgi:cation transporter-like permease